MVGLGWSKATVPSDVKELSAVEYGRGVFAALPASGTTAVYSTNSSYWSKTTIPEIADGYRGIAYKSATFVAVGINSEYSGYSTDGMSWQRASMPGKERWNDVACGDGKFVAVSLLSTSTPRISQAAGSLDGLSWEYVSISHSYSWTGIAYGGGKFVAVSSDGYFTYSSDRGATWSTPAKIADGYAFPSIVYGNGYFIAVGTSKLAYSSNGAEWSTVTLPSTGTWGPIAYGNGRLVIVSTSTAKAIYSDTANGTIWGETSLPPFGSESESWNDVTYGNGRFVAVGGSASSVIIAYSNDQENHSPTTPGSITVPAEVYPGDNFTVEWGASTDPDGNLSGYDVQRSYDGSSTWVSVASGTTSTSIITSVEDGHTNVQYRVRARDSSGATSAWRSSSLIAIVNIKAYIGVDEKARAVRKIYVGIEGKAREVVKGYVGVNGLARRFM